MGFKNILQKIKINQCLKKYKYIHLMFNDKFNKPFVDFLNRNFDNNEHLILCKKFFDEFPMPEGNNVFEIKSLKGLDLNKNNIKKIICHSLFDNELIEYFYNNKKLLSAKTYWMIWGGDLYNSVIDKKNDFVRQNFKGYISDTNGDCDVVKKKYNISNAEFYEAGYTFPITLEMFNNDNKYIKIDDCIKIQINNSCDKSTLEMLGILSKFKDETIKIKTILSYGQLEYKNEIIKKGTEIYGEKFEYLDKILSPNEYAKYISNNNILILNQDRQQGLGNSFAALHFGTKLYIKSDITTFKHFIQNNCKIFDTNKIKNMNFEEFINIDIKTKNNNINNSTKFFTDEYLKELWYPIFYGKGYSYWDERAEKFGEKAVYNMTHLDSELNDVDKKQKDIYKSILKTELSGNEKTALDYGCGCGRFTNFLTDFVSEKVFYIDPTEKLVQLVNGNAKTQKLNYKKNIINLPDKSIDLIFVSLVLGGITNSKDLEKLIEEFNRISSDNALFFIVENTEKCENSNYWHYRSSKEYQELFKFVKLHNFLQYKDCGEEISVFIGKNQGWLK